MPSSSLTRALSRHLRQSLAGSANSHPDALAYIAAIEAAGAAPSTAQKSAINSFFTGGHHDSMGVILLPVWGAATPNAINLSDLSSGTWGGTVTHDAAGWVKGSTNGYFDTGLTPSECGASLSSVSMGYIQQDSSSDTAGIPIGSVNNFGSQRLTAQYSGGGYFGCMHTSTGITGTASSAPGVYGWNFHSGTRRVERVNAAGFSSLASVAGADQGSLPTVDTYFLAANNGGTATSFCRYNEYGAFFLGGGLSVEDFTAFATALRDLYTSLTGDSL